MVAIDLVLNPTVDGVSRCGWITGKPEARVKWRNQAITLTTETVAANVASACLNQLVCVSS